MFLLWEERGISRFWILELLQINNNLSRGSVDLQCMIRKIRIFADNGRVVRICGSEKHGIGIPVEKAQVRCFAVSYTHLDVYKRQRSLCGLPSLPESVPGTGLHSAGGTGLERRMSAGRTEIKRNL